MNRRSFIATLLGGAAGAKYLTLPAAEELPTLPVPKHDPISLVSELQVSVGRCPAAMSVDKSWRGIVEYYHLGRAICGKWELNEDGFLVNRERISFASSFLRQQVLVDKVIINDPRKPWMITVGDLRQPKKIGSGDSLYFEEGGIGISPEDVYSIQKANQTLEETYPELHSWKKDLQIPCTCEYYFDYEDAGIRAPERKVMLDNCPIHGRFGNSEYRIS